MKKKIKSWENLPDASLLKEEKKIRKAVLKCNNFNNELALTALLEKIEELKQTTVFCFYYTED
jgi:hypothetical protein